MKRLLALLIGITLIMLLMAGCGGEKKEAFNWAGSDVTVDTVKKALEQKTPAKPVFSDTDFPQNITDVQVLDNVAKPGQKNILIYYKSGTVWDECLEVTRIYSIAGLLPKDHPVITERPFRTPHHSASAVSIIGGGRIPRPGEVSFATHGVLFLDELPEFHRDVLEALRQPLEEGVVTVTRASGAFTFPARFILAASMNPWRFV